MRISTTNVLYRLRDRSLDLLFPPNCLHCAAEIEEPSQDCTICAECREQLLTPPGTVCQRCGARVPDVSGSVATCPRCEAEKVHFDATFALGQYEGLLRDLVLKMKNDRTEQVGRLFARLILEQRGEELRQMSFDAVVPIPMAPWRRFVRGTNPPEAVARHIASKMEWNHFPHLLKRRRNSLPQHGLSRRGRFRNVRGRVRVNRGYSLESPHILLVDDVLTTGATCSEAARILKKHGATRVTVLVVGRTSDV